MKKYMMNVVKNLAVLANAGNENAPAEMLKRNSYSLLNLSPRFF